jgi:hypothetical protein
LANSPEDAQEQVSAALPAERDYSIERVEPIDR